MTEYYGNNDFRDYVINDYLAHHGILGMKWGHKNGPPYPLGAGDHSKSEQRAGWRKSLGRGSGSTPSKKKLRKDRVNAAKRLKAPTERVEEKRTTNSDSGEASDWKTRRKAKKTVKTATKDAKRFADAKMFYGEGAGNRRKLLKAELNKKMEDPEYKKAFDSALENVDYAKSAKKAKGERHRKDAANHEKINAAIKRTAGTVSKAAKDRRSRAAAKAFLKRAGVYVVK